MPSLRSIAMRLRERATAADLAPLLRRVRQAGRGLARAAAIAWRWFQPRARRLLVHLGRLLRRFARWAAANPVRSADLLVGLMLTLAVISMFQLPGDRQLAVVTVPLDYTSDLDCLALNIYHEARGEPDVGRLAVAMVVMNRVSDPRFPNDVCAVVKQGGEQALGRCQFSWWCDGRSDTPRDAAAWSSSRRLAEAVLAGRFEDPTGGALWYHADHVKPTWQMAIVRGPQIGRHIFYASAQK